MDVPGGLGYLVKQWPVDEYVRFYNQEKHQKQMLEERVLLNDIYFFIQQGLVKLYHRDEVEHVSGKKYRLGEKGAPSNCREQQNQKRSKVLCTSSGSPPNNSPLSISHPFAGFHGTFQGFPPFLRRRGGI